MQIILGKIVYQEIGVWTVPKNNNKETEIIKIQNIFNKLFCFVLYTVVEIADNGNQTKIQELGLKITLC